MEIFIRKGSPIPSQAHAGEDAAYDISATSEPEIRGIFIDQPLDGMRLYSEIHFIEYKTGLFYQPQPSKLFKEIDQDGNAFNVYHTHIFPRSSCCNYNLVLANSVATIDAGFSAELILRFKYIPQPKDFTFWYQDGIQKIFIQIDKTRIYKLGDKIGQLIIAPTIFCNFKEVDELPKTIRGIKSFGSSGQ